jgi:translation initiation factor 3 subunit I
MLIYSISYHNANASLFYSETEESLLVIKGPQGRINRAVWGPLNETIISGGEDTVIRIWDSEAFLISYIYLCCVVTHYHQPTTIISFYFTCLQTGKLLKESDKESGHKKTIQSLVKSADGSHFLTGSLDKSAKVFIFCNMQ